MALAVVSLLVFASVAQAALVFKRLGPHPSVMRFQGTPKVWCGPWGQGSARTSIHIQLPGPQHAWFLTAVRADVESGQRIVFPGNIVSPGEIVSSKPRGAIFFVAQRKPLIEASSDVEEASGFLFFSQASCALGTTVSFTAHVVLGSELFEGTKVGVNGTFTGTVTEEP